MIHCFPEHLKGPAYSYPFIEYYKTLPSDTTYDDMLPFLPVTYMEKWDEMQKECMSNYDCALDEYCDEQVDKNVEKLVTNRFCYKVPTFFDKTEGPKTIDGMIIHRFNILPMCDSDEECEYEAEEKYATYNKHIELLKCDITFGFGFPRYLGYIHIYKGLCVKSRRVAFIQHKTYLSLGLDVLFEERKQYFPVGNQYDDSSMIKNIKNCTSNQDCGYGQFCGPVLNFVTKTAHKRTYYCFSAPNFLDSNHNPIVLYTGGSFELFQCDSSTRCPPNESLRCYNVTEREFVPQNDNGKKSYCIKEHPVAYVLSETYFNLPSDVLLEEKKKYFPVDFVDLLENSELSKCSTNRDCSKRQFCGSILDYTTNSSGTTRHCYRVPTLPYTSRIPRIVPNSPESNELALCESDSDCISDDIWQCDLETGQKFVFGKFGETRELKNGICIIAPPVAFTFSQTYLNLSHEISYEYKMRYFPVDYLGPGKKNILASCSLNMDCQQGQFCDRVLDFVNKKIKGSRTHCFAIPRIDPAENIQIIIESNELGLMLCNSTVDCLVDLFCNTGTGQKYLKWNDDNAKGAVVFDGVCMKNLNPKPLPDSTWLIILIICIVIGVVIAGSAATVFILKKKKIKLESKGSTENVQSPVNQLESKSPVDNVALKPVPSRTASLDNVVVQK